VPVRVHPGVSEGGPSLAKASNKLPDPPKGAGNKTQDMNKIRAYIQEVGDELLHKVTWPTWSELQESAIIVMIATVIFSVVVFAMDFAFQRGMAKLYEIIG
jgi:preprotein translocase subunit SecE